MLVPRRSAEPTQTLKKWLTRQPKAQTPRQLQVQLDTFRACYNTVRPHRALSRRTPQQAYDARPNAVPTGTPLDDSHYRIRHDKIDPSGVFTLRHNSRLHHIGIGRRHAGTDILILVHDLHIRVLTTIGELLRELPPRPEQGLSTTTQNVNDVSRHLCTVSRDITMAVAVGFEPTEGVNPHALSRRAPSAARTRYRRSRYRTYRRGRPAVVSEELSEQGGALVS